MIFLHSIKSSGVFYLALVMGLFACKREINYARTASGLEYFYFYKSDTGKAGKPGDYYLLQMTGLREDDSVFINSYQLGQKIKMVRTVPPFHSLFNDALGMLRIGDSIQFRLPADSFFKPLGQEVPKYLRKGSLIRFTLKVYDILNPQEHLIQMYEYEYDRMEAYLKEKRWNFQTDTATGIKYEIVSPGNSLRAAAGDEVEISYLMTYLDGKIINRTRPGDVMRFEVGSADYMPAISKLSALAGEGSKIQAVIPFASGFGEEGTAYIDPYATLVIEMDIKKIVKKNPNL